MNDDCYLHGSDSYIGHCTECGCQTGTNYNEPCEDCIKDKPVKCPKCLDMVHPSHMTEHGCCIVCVDAKAEDFTERILIINEIMEEMK